MLHTITGTMTTQTITYLQRDAHLPQTGTMNAATQAHSPPSSPTATTRWAPDHMSRTHVEATSAAFHPRDSYPPVMAPTRAAGALTGLRAEAGWAGPR